MKLKINPKLYLFGSIFLAIVIAILASITNPCNFPNHGWLGAVLLIMFMILGFKWLPFAKNNYLWLLFIVICSIGFFYLSVKAQSRNIERESIVISAQIIDRISSGRAGSKIRYVHLNDSIKSDVFTTHVSIEAVRNRKVNIGDTILIRFAASCPSQSRIFRLSPTREEVERFKNGVLYRDIREEE
jgi:hypothetical protein